MLLIPFNLYVHDILSLVVKEGDKVIDATCGNGNDTLFLAKLVGEEGKVFAFDIQQQAINITTTKLKENNLYNRVNLILESHELIDDIISEPIKVAIFNLGYLPKGDKKIVTKAESTIKGILGALKLLVPNGLIVITVYTGHDNGVEGKEIEFFLQNLEQKKYTVLKNQFINQKNDPPYVLIIEKK